MSLRDTLIFAALAMMVSSARAAPPNRGGSRAHGRARSPKAATPPDENPYADALATPPAPATAPSAAANAAPSADATASTSSGDAKLDAPPPAQTAAQTGPKPSPLNPEPPESPGVAPPRSAASLDQLISDVAALRARVAALTTSLFSSKLKIYVHADGDDARVQSFVVTLDDGVVFHGDTGFTADDEKVVYEHAVAPGNHVVGIQIERADARGAAFKTWQTTRFSIQVPERKELEAIVVVTDDSNMAKDFPGDQDGKYQLSIRLRAKVAE